ncbi:AAC(3) family N-acetyltransferase [Motilimonas sp. E26]|uniref:AAC(3) family N-acetyltransferase n=1 Tax=Motilimonas sp. E26 TaxID=2865674 RepID=UPI001E3109EC|nr:AAC(3) family N-acetyltransferase [Motilimonas sp. E26]MCE0556223.1 AAC(3) family N-acetyltransferase [Motilimonas sp. E26]
MGSYVDGKRYHYTQDDIVTALREAGVVEGDLVFSHIALLPLGLLKEMQEGQSLVNVFVEAIKTVLGPKGSFITPTFSYSFCHSAPFDNRSTPSAVGAFSEVFRGLPGVSRSNDPLFSVAGFGPHALSLFSNLPNTSFGKDSFFERLLSTPCKICNIGLDLRYLTSIHSLEKKLNVPYRFDKAFTGELNGHSSTWQYYVRLLCENSEADCLPLQHLGEHAGLVKQVALGRGSLFAVELQPYIELALRQLKLNPWFLAKGPELTEQQLAEIKEQS